MRTILAILTALLLTSLVASAEETCPTEETDADTGDTPAGRYYLVVDDCGPSCLFSVWIYQESNGQDGLQRCHEGIPESCEGCDRDTSWF